MDKSIIDRFPEKTILVLGDVMLDKYIWGRVSRISPEAPVQIVEVQSETYAPGGAANAANNIVSLGGKAVLIGMVGDDFHKDILIKELEQRGIASQLVLDNRPTTTKIRVMGQRQQLVRIDYEHKHPIDDETGKKILEVIKETPSDAIVISDYAKGIITQQLYDEILRLAESLKVPVFVDVKPRQAVNYAGATVIKTNHKEACELAGVEEHNDDGIENVGKMLVEHLKSNIVITRGERGVSIFSREGKITHAPTKAKQVFDVTGAGDTFLAALALSFASGASLEDSSIIANHAAGIKVGKIGTASVSAEELRQDLQ
ncbi:MAG: D-glycero-beta-D-manno-heptose-7-phosphate kinase [Candidatus Woesearchaeota archaeon]